MKVLTVSSLPDRDQGGVERLVKDLVKCYKESDVESLLVTNGISMLRDTNGHYVIPMHDIETRKGIPTYRCVARMVRSFKSVWHVLRQTQPDVVHVHFIDYPLLYWIALRPFYRYKLVVTGHGSEVLALRNEGSRSLRGKLLPLLIARADSRTATVAEISNALSEISKESVTTVNNGVDLE